MDLGASTSLPAGDAQDAVQQGLAVRIAGIRRNGLLHGERLELDVAGAAIDRPTAPRTVASSC